MKRLEEYKWMCPEPFTNVMHSTSGLLKPCCAFHADEATLQKHEWKKYNAREHSFSEFYNSKQMIRLRSALRNDDDVEFVSDMCRVCKEQERTGSRSHRQFYLSRFQNELSHKKAELEHIIHHDAPPSFYHSAELNGMRGNICNLSCLMCSSGSSSMYNKEAIAIGEERIRRLDRDPEVSPEFLEDLIQVLQKTEEIKFTGGEPLIDGGIYNIIDRLSNKSEVILRIVTNGTVGIDEFIEKSKGFKRVIVNVSVEAVGALNDYIRYPSTFSVIDDNINKLIRASHINTYVTSTIGALNVGYVHEMCQHYGDRFTAGSYIVNNFYNIKSIPDDIKDSYLNKLYAYGSKYAEVRKIIKYLENIEHDPHSTHSMLSHIKRRDQYRGKSLIDVLPEWKHHYEDHSS